MVPLSALIDTYGMPSQATVAPFVGALRYISHDDSKCVNAAQVRQLHAWGKVVCLNFEDTQTNAKGGYAAGLADGQFSVNLARSLGAPGGVAIYYSVDFQADYLGFTSTVLNYFRGVDAAHAGSGFMVGVYGDQRIVAAVLDANLASLGWQTVAWSGARDTRAVLYQDEFNPDFDVDEIEQPFYGAWTPDGPQPNPNEVDMTPAQAQQLNDVQAQVDALGKRLAAIDNALYAVNGGATEEPLRKVLNDVRGQLQVVAAKLGA